MSSHVRPLWERQGEEEVEWASGDCEEDVGRLSEHDLKK